MIDIKSDSLDSILNIEKFSNYAKSLDKIFKYSDVKKKPQINEEKLFIIRSRNNTHDQNTDIFENYEKKPELSIKDKLRLKRQEINKQKKLKHYLATNSHFQSPPKQLIKFKDLIELKVTKSLHPKPQAKLKPILIKTINQDEIRKKINEKIELRSKSIRLRDKKENKEKPEIEEESQSEILKKTKVLMIKTIDTSNLGSTYLTAISSGVKTQNEFDQKVLSTPIKSLKYEKNGKKSPIFIKENNLDPRFRTFERSKSPVNFKKMMDRKPLEWRDLNIPGPGTYKPKFKAVEGKMHLVLPFRNSLKNKNIQSKDKFKSSFFEIKKHLENYLDLTKNN